MTADFDGERDYERFKEAVPQSWRAVFRLAEFLQSRGMTVQIPAMALCASFEDRNGGYGDAFDLSVLTHYEVKQHDFGFTCAADYPYRNIIVDRKAKIDGLKVRVSAYWQLNKSMTHALVIRQSSRDKWFPETLRDSVKGFSYNAYMCPKECAEFYSLEERLRPRANQHISSLCESERAS